MLSVVLRGRTLVRLPLAHDESGLTKNGYQNVANSIRWARVARTHREIHAVMPIPRLVAPDWRLCSRLFAALARPRDTAQTRQPTRYDQTVVH